MFYERAFECWLFWAFSRLFSPWQGWTKRKLLELSHQTFKFQSIFSFEQHPLRWKDWLHQIQSPESLKYFHVSTSMLSSFSKYDWIKCENENFWYGIDDKNRWCFIFPPSFPVCRHLFPSHQHEQSEMIDLYLSFLDGKSFFKEKILLSWNKFFWSIKYLWTMLNFGSNHLNFLDW